MISKISRHLFKQTRHFSVAIKSVPGDRPPKREENVEGRYAGVLFSIASKNQELDQVNDDMMYLSALMKESPKFTTFIQNTSNTRAEVEAVLSSLGNSISQSTIKFLGSLIESKRISDLSKISKRFSDYYKLLNKEEGATIISARELTADQKMRLQRTLEETYQGTTFTVKYEVDPSILGGLQIYFGNSFMDASLLSRVQNIRGEFEKLSM